MKYDEYYAFRSELIDKLEKDLIGPSSPEEVISDRPTTNYITGILYPQQRKTLVPLDPALDIDTYDEDDEGLGADPPVALCNVRYPSSMGMTFAVDSHLTKEIALAISAGRYVKLDAPNTTESHSENTSGVSKNPWQRFPLNGKITLDITKQFSGYQSDFDLDGLKIFYRVRPQDKSGVVPVTVVILNSRESQRDPDINDSNAFFQTEIVATCTQNKKGVFVGRRLTTPSADDEDIRTYSLLYRKSYEFAVGHGCSASWQLDSDSTNRASRVSTTYAPGYELPLVDSNPNIEPRATEMLWLTNAKREDVIGELNIFCEGYEQWIKERQHEVDQSKELDSEQRNTAIEHLSGCLSALARMRAGIDLLKQNTPDNAVWKAFRYMNSAMLLQRSRTNWLRAGKPAGGPKLSNEHKWRPFQLAFVLLCLEGIAKSDSTDRKLADLLWFPTGGGKTEAYLGLIAFTTFLRRLRNTNGYGVTALMRYTLRLLTIQQFERASLLICCCEYMRRQNPELGTIPISIGLWLGRDATPNNRSEAGKALDRIRAGTPLESLGIGNPIQLHSCPWCGQYLDHRNYSIATDVPRMIIACRTPSCDFASGLPVYLIDEDVYDHRPTLIIATVDKFASLPWREEAADLFNIGSGLPPELIIQDELHLISGPLGTLVGLYETAIDILCTQSGPAPKIIASTATIRHAGQQVLGLFNREIRQFPPPGLQGSDSYFAVETSPEEKGTRMYLGLIAPGTSHATLLIRVYASLLQNVFESTLTNDIKDPYWTLVGYFNSLRVLGAARIQVDDDVKDRVNLLASLHKKTSRSIDEVIELSSNAPSSEIPDYLTRMAVKYPANDPKTLDVILATNMISVGVDIDRLGLMAVMGQPQSTSEYIQSTSRVGRRFPGLVVVLFNAARSRDLSHYESFMSYHSALYRQVESTSVTPFSPRARDRGLHAVLVALSRMLVPELRDNTGACHIEDHIKQISEIQRLIVERVASISKDEGDATSHHLKQLVAEWIKMAKSGDLVYRANRAHPNSLLVDASETVSNPERFPTQWSLRDVDKESNLYIVS